MPYYLGFVEYRAYILFYYEVIESKYRRLIAMQRLPLCLTIMSDYLNFKPKIFYQDLHCALYIIYIYKRDWSKGLPNLLIILMNTVHVVIKWCTQSDKNNNFKNFSKLFLLAKVFTIKMSCIVFIFRINMV